MNNQPLSKNNWHEFKALMALAIPVILYQLAEMGMSVIDTIMAGRISPLSLAAVSVGTNIFMPVLIICMGFFMSISPIISQENGRQNYHLFAPTLQHSLLLAIVFVPPSILLLHNAHYLMTWMGIRAEIIPQAFAYLKAVSWSLIPTYIFLVFRSFNEGLFSTRAILIITLLALPLNVVCNYAFVYGKWGLPEFGIVGLGYATAVVWSFISLAIIIYTISANKFRQFSLLSSLHPIDKQIFKEIFRIGIPMSITLGMEITMFAMIGLFISTLSVEATDGHQIVMNIASVSFMIPLGISIAATARVGYAVGKQSSLHIKRAGFIAIGVSSIIMICLASIMYLLSESIISLYTADKEASHIAMQLIILAVFFQLSDGLQVSASGALRGLKDTKIPMIISLLSYWVIGIPLGYYLCFIKAMGASGFWLALVFSLTCSAILLNYRFYQLSKSWTAA